MPGPNRDYIIDRATATHACMDVIKDGTPSWEWSELTVLAFKGKLDTSVELIDTEATEGADTDEARGARDTDMEALRVKMRSFVGLGKRKYRNNESKARVLSPIRIKSHTIKGTLAEAVKVSAAWTQVDATYVPEDGNTLAAFETLREACRTKYETVAKESAEESAAGGELAKALRDLYRWSVDWYQEAFRRFPVGTAHGDMIREEIPTQSGDTPLPEAASLSASWDEGISKVILIFAALHATSFEVERSSDGGTTWDPQGAATSPAEYGDMVSGTYLYRVRGLNSSGTGEWSAPYLVVVP